MKPVKNGCDRCGNTQLAFRVIDGGPEEANIKIEQEYCIICGRIWHGNIMDERGYIKEEDNMDSAQVLLN